MSLQLRSIQVGWLSNKHPTSKIFPSPGGFLYPKVWHNKFFLHFKSKRYGHRPPCVTGDPGKVSIASLHSHVAGPGNMVNVFPKHSVQQPQFNNPCTDPFTSSWCPSWHPAAASHGLGTYIWSLPHTQMHVWCGFLCVSYNWWISLWKWLCVQRV